MNSGKILLGIVASVVIGAVLSILFTPDKGASRKKNNKAADDNAPGHGKNFNEFVTHMKENANAVKEDVKHSFKQEEGPLQRSV